MKVELNENKLKNLMAQLKSSREFAFLRDLSGLTSQSVEVLQKFAPADKDIIVGIEGNAYNNGSFYDGYCGPYKYRPYYGERNLTILNLSELKETLQIMEDIEQKIDDSWTDKERAVFLWGYLTLNWRHATSNDRDAHFYKNKYGTSVNFAKALNELLWRQNIQSYIFSTSKHSFNMVKLDDKFYPVDVDLTVRNKLENFFGKKGYFSLPGIMSINKYIEADNEEMCQAYFENDEIVEILDKVLPVHNKKREAINGIENEM